MFPSRLRTVIACLAMTVSFIPTVSAGGGGLTGGSTEITQLLNNGELVAQVQQQVRTVSQLVQIYTTQYQQLQEQLRAGMSISGLNIGDVLKIKGDLDNYQGALRTFGRDLGQLQNVFDVRMTEARLSNMTLQQYLQREQQQIDLGNNLAKARINRELAQVDQVRRDVALVRELGDKIPGTVGVHQSTQLLNSQMNVVAQQLTRLVQLTAEAQGSDKAIEAQQKAYERAAAARNAQQLTEMNTQQKALEKQQIEALRNMRELR